MNGMDGLCEGHGPKGPISVVNECMNENECNGCLFIGEMGGT